MTYTWSTNETLSTIVVSPTSNTTYTVQGTDANGCENSTSITQNVSTCTGIESIDTDYHFNVYPNPTQGQFFIDVNTEITIHVLDVLGNIVLMENLKAGKHTINIENQSSGIYFLNVKKFDLSKTIRIIKY